MNYWEYKKISNNSNSSSYKVKVEKPLSENRKKKKYVLVKLIAIPFHT